MATQKETPLLARLKRRRQERKRRKAAARETEPPTVIEPEEPWRPADDTRAESDGVVDEELDELDTDRYEAPNIGQRRT